MTVAPTHDRLAGRLALAGAAMGILAGAVELSIGPSIREWVGDKQDTTRLGLATMFLSAIALTAAAALRSRGDLTGGRRVAIGLGLLTPALVCLTTVGRLWYVPGALLALAGGLTLAGARPRELATAFDEDRWRTGLLVLCGVYYVFLGATALGFVGALGIGGGALVWASVPVASRSRHVAYALLLGGALPFAAMTWWSVVTPLIAVLALVIGRGVIRRARPRPTAAVTGPAASTAAL